MFVSVLALLVRTRPSMRALVQCEYGSWVTVQEMEIVDTRRRSEPNT